MLTTTSLVTKSGLVGITIISLCD